MPTAAKSTSGASTSKEADRIIKTRHTDMQRQTPEPLNIGYPHINLTDHEFINMPYPGNRVSRKSKFYLSFTFSAWRNRTLDVNKEKPAMPVQVFDAGGYATFVTERTSGQEVRIICSDGNKRAKGEEVCKAGGSFRRGGKNNHFWSFIKWGAAHTCEDWKGKDC